MSTFALSRSLFKPTAIAAGALVCLATVSGTAAASDPDMQHVKVYGNVTVAQDSVSSWGPWEQFEPPAAGQQGRVNAPVDTREKYRPLHKPQADNSGCAPGSVCGYAVSYQIPSLPTPSVPTEQSSSVRLTAQGEEGPSLPQPTLHVVHVLSTGGPAEGTTLSNQINVLTNPLAGKGSANTGPLGYIGDNQHQSADAATTVTINLPDQDAGVSENNFILVNYVDGVGGRLATGAVGRVTSTPDMAALRADNATGYFYGTDSTGGKVQMNVNFGKGTFTYNTTGGELNYDAAGSVKGSGYNATSFQTANTSGTLLGSFVGRNAAGTVGAADVTQNGFNSKSTHATVRGAVD